MLKNQWRRRPASIVLLSFATLFLTLQVEDPLDISTDIVEPINERRLAVRRWWQRRSQSALTPNTLEIDARAWKVRTTQALGHVCVRHSCVRSFVRSCVRAFLRVVLEGTPRSNTLQYIRAPLCKAFHEPQAHDRSLECSTSSALKQQAPTTPPTTTRHPPPTTQRSQPVTVANQVGALLVMPLSAACLACC